MATQITLPRDAEGREIPLDTKVLYNEDGDERKVYQFKFQQCTERWLVDFKRPCGLSVCLPENYLLDPHDSWEKLLEDLDNTAEKASCSTSIATPCAWFSGGNRHCADCPADEPPEDTCGVKLIKNIAARIRKLRGGAE